MEVEESSVCLSTMIPVLLMRKQLWRSYKTYSRPCTWSVKEPDLPSRSSICAQACVWWYPDQEHRRTRSVCLLHHDIDSWNSDVRHNLFFVFLGNIFHLFASDVV